MNKIHEIKAGKCTCLSTTIDIQYTGRGVRN